ncbi:hypothetical protein [Georgenia halophila]|uniref:hypothetical protein n=1 Tax=Georgenia halophila TaxID=620889 RepID=UPI0031E8FF2D
MPSYRVTMTVGLLRPSVDPADLLPAAAAAAGERTTVEAKDVGLVRGQARITVRFTAADDGEAHLVGAAVHERADELAEVGAPVLTLRVGGRWLPV